MEKQEQEKQYRIFRYRLFPPKEVERRIEEHFQAVQRIFNSLRAKNIKNQEEYGEELPLKELIRLSFEESKKLEGIRLPDADRGHR